MKKRILAAVLASASILGAVAGCSSNATSSAGSSTTDSSKTEDSSKTDDSSNAGTSDKFTLKEGEGKTLNIAVWNEEIENYFNKYLKDKMPEGVTVNFKKTENANNAYQNKLDEDLPKNEAASADDKICSYLKLTTLSSMLTQSTHLMLSHSVLLTKIFQVCISIQRTFAQLRMAQRY